MHLHVLPLTWTDLGYRYTFPEIWPTLLKADLATAPLVLTEPDFQAYDWQHQELWLTPATTDRLRETGLDRLFHAGVGQAFVTTLEDERLYGGLFYDPSGAAAIQFPVIHALGSASEVLRIRPALGPWKPDHPRFAQERQRIDDPRLATWLQARRLLVTVPPGSRPPDGPELWRGRR